MAIKQLDIQQGYALFAKKSHQTKPHRHYGIELVFCKNGCFDLYTEKGKYLHLNAAIIPSNLAHKFQCGDSTCQLLFLDPLSMMGQYVFNQYHLHREQDILVNPPDIEHLFINNTSAILPDSRDIKGRRKIDFRIHNCVQEIRNTLNCSELSIKQLSELSHLSESRLSHLFKEQVGISIRQFVLWNRVVLAVSKSKEGHSLTTAAHYAGFTDSSHFTKVFSDMFGSSPFHTLKPS